VAPEPGASRADADRSFEQLYEGHREEVYRAALRALGNADDAEDVTQAAFVDAYRAILRGSRPRAPRAWLLAIAENVRRRRFRSALRRPREEPLDPESAAATELEPEQAETVRRALEALSPQQREVFLLRELSGLSYGEIAERTGATTASVQMVLFRARCALRAELDPPPVTQRRRSLGLQLPAWLAQLAGRGDALVLAPRGAGAVGAAVLAVSGVTAGALHVQRHGDPRPPALVQAQPRLLPPPRLTAVRAAVRRESAPARAPGLEPRAAPTRRSPVVAPVNRTPEPVPTPAPVAAPAAPGPVPTLAAVPPVAVPPVLPRKTPAPASPPVTPPALVVPLPESTPPIGSVPPVELPLPPVVVPLPQIEVPELPEPVVAPLLPLLPVLPLPQPPPPSP
jgi:RNA polymerase sigma factor (sigma-70 family)